MTDWRATWGEWPVNPDVFDGPNPHVWLLVADTSDYGPVIAGVYTSEDRARAAMMRRIAEGHAPRLEILPSVQLDHDLWAKVVRRPW